MDRLFNTNTLRLFPQRTLLFRSRTTGLEKARIMNMTPMKYPRLKGVSTLQLSNMMKVSLASPPLSPSKHVIS